MNKIKKIFLILFFVLLFILIGNKSDASSSSLELKYLNFYAEILENGDMKVTERWDIYIRNTNTLFKTFKTDINKYTDITDVKVKEIVNGERKEFNEISRYMYHVNKDNYYGLINDDGDFEIAWGVGLDNDSDRRVYEISYKVEDAIGKYKDYSQLYWQFVGENFEIDANKIRGVIILPNEANNKEEIRVWGHTKGLNGEIYATDNDKIEFTIDDFKAGTYVEIRTLFPNYILNEEVKREYNHEILGTVLDEEEDWANEANRIRNIRNLLVVVYYIVIIIISILLIINIIKKIKLIVTRKLRKPSQEITYFREIPREDASPGEAVYLLKKAKGNLQSNDIGKIFSATILNFSLKKLIEVEEKQNEKGKEEIYIKLKDKEGILNLENKDEKEIGAFLISAFGGRENTEINVKKLEKFIKNSSPRKILNLQEDIKNGFKGKLLERKIIDEEGQDKYLKEARKQITSIYICFMYVFLSILVIEKIGSLALIGSIILGVILFIRIILSGIAITRINFYTQEGIDEIEKWKGLKKYMEEFSLLNEREVPEIAIWEKFLVYATAFGIADKVLKQIKIVYPDIENNINVNTYPYMHLMIHTNFSRSFSSAISSSMSSAYSSASGGGGGFSGGGGGRSVAGGRRSAEDKTFALMKEK